VLATQVKRVVIRLTGVQGLARAISSAGGVDVDELDDGLMLRKLPGVFVAGEMIDWEAPTGGYLLQACFATGFAAAEGVLAGGVFKSR
jgi:predicted flavoprotein YhiN